MARTDVGSCSVRNRKPIRFVIICIAILSGIISADTRLASRNFVATLPREYIETCCNSYHFEWLESVTQVTVPWSPRSPVGTASIALRVRLCHNDDRNLLEVLKFEVEFLEQRGYGPLRRE